QAIALAPAEADIGTDLWQADLADTGAIGRKDVHTVVAVAHPSHAGPDVAVLVAADTIGEARLAVESHLGEGLAILQLVAIHVVHPDDAFGVGVVRFPRIGNVDLLVIGAETHVIRLERLVGDFGHFTALGVDSIHGLFDEWLHIVGAIAFAF